MEGAPKVPARSLVECPVEGRDSPIVSAGKVNGASGVSGVDGATGSAGAKGARGAGRVRGVSGANGASGSGRSLRALWRRRRTGGEKRVGGAMGKAWIDREKAKGRHMKPSDRGE